MDSEWFQMIFHSFDELKWERASTRILNSGPAKLTELAYDGRILIRELISLHYSLAYLLSFLKNRFQENRLPNPRKNFFWNKSPQVKRAKTFFFPKNLWGSEIHGNKKDNLFRHLTSQSTLPTSVRWIIPSMSFLRRRCWRGRLEVCSGACGWWKTSGHESPWYSGFIVWNTGLVVLFVFQKFLFIELWIHFNLSKQSYN